MTKKMSLGNKIGVLLLVLCVDSVFSAVLQEQENTNDVSPRGIDAKSLLSFAGNLMSRGYVPTAAGSQVISLNLTNLLVLVLLKALIFAAGSFGSMKGGYGRSNDFEEAEHLFTEDELLLYLSFLTGEPRQEYGCLKNVACREPSQAEKYVKAGDMLLRAGKLFGVEERQEYRRVVQELQEAVEVGTMLGDCSRFECRNEYANE